MTSLAALRDSNALLRHALQEIADTTFDANAKHKAEQALAGRSVARMTELMGRNRAVSREDIEYEERTGVEP